MNYLFRLSIVLKKLVPGTMLVVGTWWKKSLEFKCLKGQLACHLINK